jgi:hypothetical protein
MAAPQSHISKKSRREKAARPTRRIKEETMRRFERPGMKRGALPMYLPAAVLLLAVLLLPEAARAQWTQPDTSNNISNTNAGNVGVGTPSPTARLQVAGDITASGNLSGTRTANGVYLWDDGSGGNVGALTGGTNARNLSVQGQNLLFFSGTTYAERMRITPGGNVGVGTNAPGERLELYDPSATVKLKIGTGGASANSYLVLNAAGGRASIVQKQTGGTNGGQALFYASDDVNGRLFALDSTSAFGDSSAELMVKRNGNVGIGTVSPLFKLDVNGAAHIGGDITVDGNISAKYQDVAEWVPSSQKLRAGTVVVLDTTQTNHVLASTKAYDTGVAGVVSDSPGVILGQGGADKLKVATTGRVKVRVDATRAPVRVGDLLVTSEVEGVAMKSVPVELGGVQIHRPGTIIGKALEPLDKGTGEILVLLSLQ